MNVYLGTSDKTKFIEPATTWLWEKYANKTPKFISNNSAPTHQWCANMYNHLYAEGLQYNDYVIFGLEDMLPIYWWDDDIVSWVMSYQPDRYELGWGALVKKEIDMINGEIGAFTKKSPYRLSTQISIWRYGVLLKFLEMGKKRNWTPHQFEVNGTNESRKFDLKILGTKTQFAFRWIEETAISFRLLPDRINVLGLKPYDVEQMIKNGLLERDKLNFGIRGVHPKLRRSKIGRKYIDSYE